MLHTYRSSATGLRRRISSALICAGIASGAFALSAAVAPTVSMAAATQTGSSATSDASNVYIKIGYSGTPTWTRAYIDTDRSSASGYPFNGIGAEYLIENGSLYRYSGTGGSWAWTFVKTVASAATTGSTTFTVARADIGSPSAFNMVTTADASASSIIQVPLSTVTTTTPTPTGGNVNYTASSATINNPERGFYTQVPCDSAVSLSQLQSLRNSGQALVLCVFHLGKFVTSSIDQTTLNLFNQNMTTVRQAGMKAIVRFAYTDTSSTDATPTMVNTHLTQLAPYIASNSDIIAVMQAGLIGQWGEWGNTQHYGDSYNMTAQNIADRKSVVDKLLSVLPADRMVQLRMPLFKTKLYSSTALTSSEAFTGTAKARLGFHNDCFLSNSSDYGTYVNPSVEYPYLQTESNYVPTGGETCAYIAPRSDCPTALSTMSMFHWSYLNSGYNMTVLNNWQSQGCYTQVSQKMGYRFVLVSGSFSSTAKPGGAFTVNLTVQNQGWAAPFNGRNVELVFRNTATGALYRIQLATDPRRWQAGQTVTISQTVTLPSTMPQGNYALLLNLPDPKASLSSRPEYSIQMANANTWEASTGFNNLNFTVGVAP
jgi:hypothetical protein